MYKNKTWIEKLREDKGLPKVVPITEKQAAKWGTGTIAIPSPMEVYNIMAKVPKGKLITVREIRKAVAKKHDATIGCPLVCGILISIAANATEEIADQENKKVIPYWRTLKSDGYLNEKYPGGVDAQKAFLEEEGYKVIQRGNRYIVKDYDKYLVKV